MQKKRVIEKDIVDYLSRHPAAEDTLEGVIEWWLLEQRIQQTVLDVKAALDKLVAKNMVREIRRADGRVSYSLPRRKP